MSQILVDRFPLLAARVLSNFVINHLLLTRVLLATYALAADSFTGCPGQRSVNHSAFGCDVTARAG
jgi:hypothetical protein